MKFFNCLIIIYTLLKYIQTETQINLLKYNIYINLIVELLVGSNLEKSNQSGSTGVTCLSTTNNEFQGSNVGIFGLNQDPYKIIVDKLKPHWSVSVRFDMILYQLEQTDCIQVILSSQVQTFVEPFYVKSGFEKQICGDKDALILYNKNITHKDSTFAISIYPAVDEQENEDGYFLKNVFVYIDACHPSCGSCSGPSDDQCLTCPNDAYKSNNKCICQDGLYSSNYDCVPTCPDGYVVDSTNKICVVNFCDKNSCSLCQNKKCIKCIGSQFKLKNGQCEKELCPNKPIAGICDNTQNLLINGQYLIKGLLNKQFSEEEVNKLGFQTINFLGASDNTSTGSKVTYCNGISLLGGAYLSGVNVTIQRDFSELAPHWSILIGYNMYLIDSWGQNDATYLKIDDDDDQHIIISSKDISQTNNICGLKNQADSIITISKNFTHSISTLKIQIYNNLNPDNSNPSNTSFGIRDFFILVDYCTADCKECDASGCLTCNPGFHLINKICSSQCANVPGFFEDQNNTCQPCNSSCYSCKSPGDENSCLSCSGNLYLQNNKCLLSCDSQQVKVTQTNNNTCQQCHPNCLTCFGTNYNNCLTCQGPALFLQPINNTCATSCYSNQFKDGQKCINCDSTCTTCSGPTKNDCLSCKGILYLNRQSSECVSNCPDKKDIQNNECYSQCDNSCLQCSGRYYNNCTKCSGSNYLDKSEKTCNPDCPVGFNKDISNHECIKCDSNCKTCNGKSSTDCLSCQSNYFLSVNTCLKCHSTCANCSGGAEDDKCTSCTGTRFLTTNKCEYNCQPGYFGDKQNNTCTKCDDSCETCDDFLSCLSCLDPLYLQGNSCVSTCNQGYYGLNNKCQKCHSTCKNCDGSLINNCLDCFSGDYFDTKKCLKCDTNCTTCSDGSGGSTKCTSCSGNFFLDENLKKCVAKCPPFYAEDKQLNKCFKCDPSCNTCDGGSDKNCLSCSGSLFLDKLKHMCVLNCPANHYEKKQNNNNTCDPCDGTCATCSGGSNNDCLTCKGTLYLDTYRHTCVSKCPDNYYPENNNICTQCEGSCATCSGGKDNECLSCTGVLYLDKNKCVQTCPIPYNKDLSNNECILCDSTCDTCFGKKNNNCSTCSGTLYLDKQAKMCVPTCPKNFFESNNECKKCDKTCFTCNGEQKENCLSCSGSYYFDKDAKTCGLSCPVDQYKDNQNRECYKECDKTCATCNGGYKNSCLSCQGSYLDKLTNTCVSKCPDNYYADKDKNKYECVQCDKSCATCFGGAYYNCLSCTGKLYYNKLINKCVEICPNGYYPKNNLCNECDSTCNTCDGQGPNKCLSCTGTRYYHSNMCILNCPDKYFPNQLSNTCDQCNTSCANCYGEQDNNCSSCNDKLYLDTLTKMCVKDCSLSQYKQLNPRKCISCDTSCLTCSGSGPNTCQSCQGSLYLNSSTKECVQKCPSGQFSNKSDNKCTLCDSKCKTCDNGTSKDCLSCNGNDFLNAQTKECLKECPPTYEVDQVNLICFKCQDECLKCASNNICKECKKDNFLEGNSCVKKCKDGFYANQQTNACEKCDIKCKTCSGPSENECTAECHHKCRTGCTGPNEEDCTTIKVQYQVIFYILIFKSSLWISSFVWGFYKDLNTEKLSTVQPELIETKNDEILQISPRKPTKKQSISGAIKVYDEGTILNLDSKVQTQQVLNLKRNQERKSIQSRSSKVYQNTMINPSIVDSPIPVTTAQLRKQSYGNFETQQQFNLIDQRKQSYLPTQTNITRSSILSQYQHQQYFNGKEHEADQKLKYMIIGNEWISLFRLNDPQVSRPNRTTLIYLKYQAFLFATQYVTEFCILITLINKQFDIKYIATCLALGWAVKLLLSKILTLVSLKSKFGNILVNMAFSGILGVHFFFWLVPQLMSLFRDKDSKWSLIYAVIFSVDVIVFQQIFSFFEYIFTKKYLNSRNEKSLKTFFLKIFKSNILVRNISK